MQTSIQSLMVSLGSFLVTTLTHLTAVFSEDLISLTIKLKRMMEGAEKNTAKQQIFVTLFTAKND